MPNYGSYGGGPGAYYYAPTVDTPPPVYTTPVLPGKPTVYTPVLPGTSAGCKSCGPGGIAGATPVGNPLGGSNSFAPSVSSIKASPTMCAESDMKTDWWKYAIAAAVGYFFAKKR